MGDRVNYWEESRTVREISNIKFYDQRFSKRATHQTS